MLPKKPNLLAQFYCENQIVSYRQAHYSSSEAWKFKLEDLLETGTVTLSKEAIYKSATKRLGETGIQYEMPERDTGIDEFEDWGLARETKLGSRVSHPGKGKSTINTNI